MSFYNLVLRSYVSNNVLENAFQYETGSLLPSNDEAIALQNIFVANVLPDIRAIVHLSTVFDRTYVVAPYDPTVFALGVFAAPQPVGLQGGEAMPRFIAWGYKCSRTRRDISDGGKRFGVLSEASQSGGIPVAAIVAQINALATEMNTVQNLTWASGTSAAMPIIVKRHKYTTPSGKTAYRIPQGTDPYEFYPAQQWVFDEITTQNSRKTGRGA